MKLTSFWFNTDVRLGYGVTATSQMEAEALLASYGYPKNDQTIVSVNIVVSTKELEQNHVANNSGPIAIYGVWFPCHNV